MDDDQSLDARTKTCKECLEELPLGRFRIHQNYRKPRDFGRSSRCRPCVKERAEKKKLRAVMRNGELEVERYYWDGITARCRRCSGRLYCDGDEVWCNDCKHMITTARQPTPLVLTRLRLLKEQAITA